MAKYRKKPVVIEAFRWEGNAQPGKYVHIPRWMAEALDSDNVYLHSGSVIIRTLEGAMKAEPGDWIIQGVKGEIYPCKPHIFELTYELVE